MHCRLFICLLTLLALALPSERAAADEIILKNAIYQGFNEDGTLRYRIHALESQLIRNDALLKGVTVEYFNKNGTVTIITTPQCYYDKTKKEIHSDSPIDVKDSSMHLTGEGFTLLPDEKRFFIRSKVKVHWKKTTPSKPQDPKK